MRRKNECGRSRWAGLASVTALALVLGVLVFVGSAGSSPRPGGALPAVPNNDKDQESTRVFDHTYDEVFQASLEALERMGYFVTTKDKDKGTISGNGIFYSQSVAKKCTFDIHVEILNTKPETQVTVNAKVKGVWGGWADTEVKRKLFMQLQQVLSTYH
jgi:hypothetical protein